MIGMIIRILPCGSTQRHAVFIAQVENLQPNAYHHEYAPNYYGRYVVVRNPPPHEPGSENERDTWRRRASNVQQFLVNALDRLLPLLSRVIPYRSTAAFTIRGRGMAEARASTAR